MYATNAAGEAFVISESSDTDLARALTQVWIATRDKSAVWLSELTHMENSAWDKAFQRDELVLDWDNVKEDDTYRENLGITP